MIHWIEYNGRNSREFPAYITKKTAYDKPEKDISFISIPGRSGDIIIDNNKYKNINIEYGIKFFCDNITGRNNFDFNALYHRIADWLIPSSEYLTLTDSYEPEYFRKACLTSSIKLSQPHYQVGSFSVTFTCKPHKYRHDGEKVLTLMENNNYITNEENAESLPYIRIYPLNAGSASVFSAGGTTYTVTSMPEYVDIDSETMNVFKGTTNYNNNFSAQKFPVLMPGENLVHFVSNIQKIELKPRWRAI